MRRKTYDPDFDCFAVDLEWGVFAIDINEHHIYFTYKDKMNG
jgi:hypothetical protein